MKITLVIFACVLFFSLLFGLVFLGIYNQEKRLTNRFNAQQKLNEASFDKMWKIIKQQTGVAESERSTFKQTYVDIMSATQGVAGNGQLASFFTQSKIDISPQLFQTVMNSIESQRESFFDNQKTLLDIKREHDNLITTFPGMLLGATPLDPVIVTSSYTENVFKNGKEDL